MDHKVTELAHHLLRKGFDDLTERERRVINRIASRVHIAQNVNRVFDEQLTFGERLSDRISAFGGSWGIAPSTGIPTYCSISCFPCSLRSRHLSS